MSNDIYNVLSNIYMNNLSLMTIISNNRKRHNYSEIELEKIKNDYIEKMKKKYELIKELSLKEYKKNLSFSDFKNLFYLLYLRIPEFRKREDVKKLYKIMKKN